MSLHPHAPYPIPEETQRVARAAFPHGNLYKRSPQSSRRKRSPTERIYWPFLMCHEHVARTLVQLLQIADTPSRANGIFHNAPEAFDGIEMVSTTGW